MTIEVSPESAPPSSISMGKPNNETPGPELPGITEKKTDPLHSDSLGTTFASNSDLQIRRASLADVHAITSILMRSFRVLPSWNWFHNIHAETSKLEEERIDADIYAHQTRLMKRFICRGALSTYIALYRGVTAGFAIWSVENDKSRDKSLLRHRFQARSWEETLLGYWFTVVDKISSCLPEGLRAWLWYPALGRPYLKKIELMRAQIRAGGERHTRETDIKRGYRMLYYLAVDPAFQRKGIASALLRPGCQEAVEDGVAIYLNASRAGRPLYEKRGFDVLAEETMGDEKEFTFVDTVMRFDPNSNQLG